MSWRWDGDVVGLIFGLRGVDAEVLLRNWELILKLKDSIVFLQPITKTHKSVLQANHGCPGRLQLAMEQQREMWLVQYYRVTVEQT